MWIEGLLSRVFRRHALNLEVMILYYTLITECNSVRKILHVLIAIISLCFNVQLRKSFQNTYHRISTN